MTLIASLGDSIYIHAQNLSCIFEVDPEVEVLIVGLHLIGSTIDGPGRAIQNKGLLIPEDVIIENMKGEIPMVNLE